MPRSLCAPALVLLLAVPAAADDKQDLDALKARVEKLEKELAVVKQQVDALAKGPAAKEAKPTPEEEQVKEAGKAFVQDLAQDNLASAYRSTTAAYQKRMERKAFDELIEKTPAVRNMNTVGVVQPEKVKKIPGDKGYEYYHTAHETFTGKPINIVLVLVKDGGEWRVDDVEVRVGK